MKFKIIGLIVIIFMFIPLAVSCNNYDMNLKQESLVVYCPHPLEFIDPIISEFENETDIAVEVIVAATGELLERVENEKDNPYGDVLWGGSISMLNTKKEFFEPYFSKNEDDFIYRNEEGYITAFTAVPSIIMVNKNIIGDISIRGYEDLLQKDLKGKIAFANPNKSSSSFEHLINQLYAMGNGNPDNGWNYVERFIFQLDGNLLDNSLQVYKGVADGQYPVGLTFEGAAAKYLKLGAPIEIIYPVEGTIIKPDGIALIKNAKNIKNGKKFIDFLTEKETQSFISNELNGRSVRKDIPLSLGLKPYDEMNIIRDDIDWTRENKDRILNKFNYLFKLINGEEN